MSKKLQLTSGSEEEVLNLYVRQRMSIKRVSKTSGVSYHSIRKILHSHNVHIRGSDYSRDSNPPPSTKLRPSQYQSLVRDLRMGQRHAQLARKYHISRERVRQIAERHHTPTGRSLQQRDALVREAMRKAKSDQWKTESARRRSQPREKLAKLWNEGLSMEDIGIAMGTTAAVIGATIGRYRKRWPTQFPYRYTQAQHSPAPSPKRTRKEPVPLREPTVAELQIVGLWNVGRTMKEIADELKVSIKAVGNAVTFVRRVSPAAVPRRNPSVAKGGRRKRPATQLLQTRTTIEDISTGVK